MVNKTLKKTFEYITVILCGVVLALNYEIFIFRNSFAPAGINGIATMIQALFGIRVGYLSLFINIPLSVFAFYKIDREYALKSFLNILAFSLGLIFFDHIDLTPFIYYTDNGTSTVLAPVAAGVVNGLMYSVLLKINACTGGMDIIAEYIRKTKPHISFGKILFVLNAGVAVASYFVFGFRIEPVLLCIIYSFVTTRVCDAIINVGKEAIKFEVITTHAEEISERLIKELRHSATSVDATGMYSGTPRQILICVINRHQIADFQRIIKEFPDTFAYISGVSETVGNFKNVKK